jgi:hypothetical protein
MNLVHAAEREEQMPPKILIRISVKQIARVLSQILIAVPRFSGIVLSYSVPI